MKARARLVKLALFALGRAAACPSAEKRVARSP